MIISRISLIGASPLTVHVPQNSDSASPGLLVISGANGSGKSLLTLALEAAFAAENSRTELALALHAAGVERVEVDFLDRGWAGKLALQLPDGLPAIEWQAVHPEADGDGKPNDLRMSVLFPCVHVVRSGQVHAADLSFVQEAVLRVRRAPVEGEVARWLEVEGRLAGEGNSGGKLGEARFALEAATADLHRVELMAQNLEAALAQQEELAAKIEEVASQREVLQAEAEELSKACVLADRAMRLDTWVAELRQESRTVQRLREQHSELQERLDGLERCFRGAPEDFPALLEGYQAAQQRERELQEKAAATEAGIERLKAEFEEIEAQLQRLPRPEVDELVARRDALSREVEAASARMTDLLRRRIELVRQREGLEQHLHRKFQPFVELNAEDRKLLTKALNGNGSAGEEKATAESHAKESVEPQVRRAEEIHARLREGFQGFDLLPPNTNAMLLELEDLRHTFATLSSDLEGLRKRSAELREKTGQSRSVLWSIITGAIGFGVITALFAWDIGLFAGLLVSGMTLMVFQFSLRRIEQDIESAVSAEAMTQRRYDMNRDAMARLEFALRPILHTADPVEAQARLEEFHSLIRELGDLEVAIAEMRAAPKPVPIAVSSSETILRGLPEPFAHMPVPVLHQLHAEYITVEQQLAELNEAWAKYAEGGAYAEQVRTLEEEIRQMQEQQTQLISEIERQTQAYQTQRHGLLSRRNTVEDALMKAESAAHLDVELAEVHERLNALDHAAGGLLRNSDVEALHAQWREREGLRLRLREIRDSLSAKQTHDELRARETLLSEEFAQVRHKLTELDPLYLLQGTAADYAAKYAGQQQSRRNDIVSANDLIRELQTEYSNLDIEGQSEALSAERPLSELRAAVDAAKDALQVVEREVADVRSRITALRDNLDHIENTTGKELADAINQQVNMFTEGRFLTLDYTDGQWSATSADGTPRALRHLSDGTCDLLWLALRTAVLEYLQGYDDCPVIWDEALSRLDERHLTNVRVAMVRLAAQRQVLLLTRHSGFEWWGPAIRLTPASSSSISFSA